MENQIIEKLITDIEQLEKDSLELYLTVPLEPAETIARSGQDDIIVLRWIHDAETKETSRRLRRKYEAWFHASLKLVEEYIPYQIDEFKAVYEVMVSYVTLNRTATTSEKALQEVEQRFSKGYVGVYLNEFENVIDIQANIIRSILYLPEESKKTTHLCFLTGFPAPYKHRENPKLVFVIMPFDKSFDDIYQLGIKETITGLGLQCKRSDEILHAKNVICKAICQPIRAARFIIADITGKNPNVFYELGMTHARAEDLDQESKKIIIITQNIDDVPFDLRNMQIIHYENIGDLRRKLEMFLSNVVSEM